MERLLTTSEIEARIAALKAEEAALKAQIRANTPLTVKVSEKGALSIYHGGRFPVTLYAEQWERIFRAAPQITEFIKAHPELARKVPTEA